MKALTAIHGLKVLKYLGIDVDYLKEAHIHIKANDIITVDVTTFVVEDNRYLTDENSGELKTLLKNYQLVERE